jgi:hypothetical protein
MEPLTFTPLLANAFKFAIDKATTEGKICIGMLILVSLFSWTVIINKALQLYKASKMSKKFFAAYRSTREPMEIFNKGTEYSGAPAYEIYFTGAEELAYADFLSGKSERAGTEDPFSRLVSHGVRFNGGKANPENISAAIDIASSQGWRRPLLAWLGVQEKRAEAAGDTAALERIRRRIALVSGQS